MYLHEFYLSHFQRHDLLARIQESVKVSDVFLYHLVAEGWEGGWVVGPEYCSKPVKVGGNSTKAEEEVSRQ